MTHTKPASSQSGFTIVELMIATAVFGAVLLVITTAIMQITRLYYKGISDAKTQAVSRRVVDLIAQGIQFNGGTIGNTPTSPTAGTSYAFCVGGQRYSFVIGRELVSGGASPLTPHALMADDSATCATGGTPTAQNLSSTGTLLGKELLDPGMRVARLEVTSLGNNLYRVGVKVVSGADDVLDNPASANPTCKGFRMGSQFCSIAELTTTVVKRVQ